MTAYVQWLSQIPHDVLRGTCIEAMKAHPAFMPTGQQIVAIWESKKKTAESNDADVEFNRMLAHCERYGATLYGGEKPLALSAAGEFAFRQVGHRAGVMRTTEEWTGQLRKNFIAAYEKFKQAEQDGHSLTQGETLALLGKVRDTLKQLA